MKPLSPSQFRDALRKGQGRAALHLREHGSAGIEADLLHACVHDMVLDAQLEGTRGEWLWQLLGLARMREVARPKILQALKEATPDDTWTAAQLFVLASQYAEEGDEEARQAIYDKFERQQFNKSSVGGVQIIVMDGVEGLLHVARVVGARMLRDPGDYETDYLIWVATEEFGETAVLTALSEQAKSDECIRAFLADMLRQKEGQAERVPTLTLDDVLVSVEDQTGKLWRLKYWGAKATTDEINAIFRMLLNERRPAQLARYLEIFGLRPMPGLTADILQLAESDHQKVRMAAFAAIANMCDDRVHELAVRLLNQTPPVVEAIGLLTLNYRPGDHRFIERVLPEQGEAEYLHGLGMEIMKVTSEVKDPQLLMCLEWVCEHGPCSQCRSHVVHRLIETGLARAELLRECLLDCSDNTRTAAREALGLPADEDWCTSV